MSEYPQRSAAPEHSQEYGKDTKQVYAFLLFFLHFFHFFHLFLRLFLPAQAQRRQLSVTATASDRTGQGQDGIHTAVRPAPHKAGDRMKIVHTLTVALCTLHTKMSAIYHPPGRYYPFFFSILCLCSTPPSTTRWDHFSLIFLCSTAYHSNSMELASTLFLSDPPQNLLGLPTSFPSIPPQYSPPLEAQRPAPEVRMAVHTTKRDPGQDNKARKSEGVFLKGAKPENRRAVRKKQGFPPLEIPPKGLQ